MGRFLWRKLGCLAALLMLLSTNAAQAQGSTYTCDARLYQIRQPTGSTGSNLFLLDRRNLTGGGTAQWAAVSSVPLNALAFNKADGYFYAVNVTAFTTGTPYRLYRLGTTGATEVANLTQIPTGDQIAAGTIDRNGKMYIKKLTSSTALYTVQLPTSAGGSIGALGTVTLSSAVPTADIAFDPVTNLIYGVHTADIPISDGASVAGVVYEINPVSGSVTTRGAGPAVSTTNAIGTAFFDIAGTLYAYQNGGVFGVINLNTGAFTRITSASPAAQSDGASCVFPDERITVAKSAGSVQALSSTVFRVPYTVTVQNTGPIPDRNVQVTEDLSRTFSAGSPTLSITSAPAISSGTATVNPNFNGTTDTRLLSGTNTLAVGDSVSVTFTVQVTYPNAASVPASGSPVNNVVYASSTSTGPNAGYTFPGGTPLPPVDLVATQTSTPTPVTMVGQSDLTVSKSDGQTSVITGAATTYTVRVTNSGTPSVTEATLRDPAVTGLTVTGVTCTPAATAPGNTCTAAPTIAQLQGTPGVALPTLTRGAFYELQVTATVTAAAGASVTNTATATLPSSLTDVNLSDNTGQDSNSVTAVPQQPVSNPASYPATCDVIDWSTSGVSSGSNQTSLGNVTRTFNSRGNRSITVGLTSASGTGNGIMGYSSSFANYGSWYEVRAVSESIQPNIGQSFLTRAGGNTSTNTIVITFPTPVINVRLGLTDLDAVGGVAGSGDWAGVQASYGGQTFNPDVLVGGGHALAVQAYTGTPSGAGAAMTVTVPGLGNSQMKAASASPTYNTLMGVDAAYGAQVTPQGGGTAVNRQGQGVASFKGPLTSLTITTGSLKGGGGQGIALGNIDFCPPSVAVDKAAGTPVRQPDYSYDIPYTLTYRNTSLNVGYHPDATVRDATFSPSIPTPTGADPWARQRPQLTDAALDQIRANASVAAVTLRGTPTVYGATNTVNLDGTDLNPAFTGTAANPNLLLANTDGRVDVGGSFNVGFTVNARLGPAVTTAQTVNNQATATASLFTGSLTATSGTVASSLTPGAALSVSKVADQALIRYPLASGATKLRYTITVTNTSGLTATGVQLTDTLPTSLPYAAGETGNTPPTTRNGQTLTWTLGDLAPNASRSVVVFVDVPTASSLEAAAGQAQTTIVNTASVQAGNAPTASGSVPVGTLYTRLFKQVRNLGPQGTLTPAWTSTVNGLPGDVLEYCIDVANLGSTTLANYRVSDVVPANTDLVPNSATFRQGRMDNPGAAVAGVTVSDTATTDAAGRSTRLLQTSALTLAPGTQHTLCFRASIR
ncbi:beta strand repeat-containing protein [Deinococcus budaensis]|uniref:beta strand repeat-containing protein n=1 Tax=Deinococcus budaensis TaxID=1665626 RepID=UPI0035F4696E